MKKKIIISLLLAGILAVSGCSSNSEKKAEESTTTTTTATTTAAASADEKSTDAPETSETEAPETTPDESTSETESGTAASGEEIPGDTVINAGVECSFETVMNNTSDFLKNGSFSYDMTADMVYSGQTVQMKTLMVRSAEKGTYTDMDMIFMKMKAIYFNDGKVVIILDDSKQYVVTDTAESGMSANTDTSTGLVPVKEPVNTADLVQLENGKKAYRFLITKENNASEDASADIYVYADSDTMLLCGMYTVQNGTSQKAFITLSENVDESYFEIPADYTEITMEEYQKKMTEALQVNISENGGEEDEANASNAQ